jgi:rfaE bifunctional protein nucleotidyltransferase chain/domain
MLSSPKTIGFASAPAFFDGLRRQGRKIVQSHGIFDLIHPGHICHLEEARTLGDVLVVTLPDDKHVQKGPGRPYFTEQLRLRSLTALACVDYAVLIPFAGAKEAIACVRPDIYCKGKEYEDPDFDPSGSLQEEIETVQSFGGEVRFIGSIKYSSTKLLNAYFDHLSLPVKEFCNALAKHYTRRDFHDAVESLADLKVLIVGDTIFDRYSYVRVQGLTSKNRIISGRFLSEETQCGGALAAFRHVRQFTNRVRFISIVGTEPWVQAQLAEQIAPDADCVIRQPGFTTIVKQRYVEPLAEGKELSKLFAVNYIDPEPPAAPVQSLVEARIQQEISRADAVLVLDFGHGLMQPRLRQLVQESARFLALNCQTNSNNHGFNIISRQYQRADAFSLDEQELMLSSGRRHLDFAAELEALRRQLHARYAWLTRGPVQTIGLCDSSAPCLCPPLESEVVDTIGAGDAFFSVAALASARQLPISLATFLGQLAGAQAVKVVGNARPISKQTLLQSGMSLLNF